MMNGGYGMLFAEEKARHKQVQQQRDDLRDENAELFKTVQIAYRERNQLVAALSKVFPSVLAPATDAEPGWSTVVMIQLPTGQVSWHIKDSEIPEFFSHLVRDTNATWDGHTTEEKYRRLNALEGKA